MSGCVRSRQPSLDEKDKLKLRNRDRVGQDRQDGHIRHDGQDGHDSHERNESGAWASLIPTMC